MMNLLPAIDILGAQVVRLARGDYNAVTRYNADPLAQAQSFAEQGAQWVHIVDLDGAKTGEPQNAEIIEQIVKQTDLAVQVGGGIRSLATIKRYVQAGAQRIVIGTQLITDPEFCMRAVGDYGDLICAGVDARSGEAAIKGWLKGSGVKATELVEQLASWGIQHLVYTDIARDGMQSGIDAAAYRQIAEAAGFAVIASGGISTLADLQVLTRLGEDIVEGAITGRAIYEGNFTIREAIEVTSC
jgi:phosphoribosylformimino-5-aminoimidazole carboxamide ribotide isomerase